MITISPAVKKVLSGILVAAIGAGLVAAQQTLVPLAPLPLQATLIALLAGVVHYVNAWGHQDRVAQAVASGSVALPRPSKPPSVPPLVGLMLGLIAMLGLAACGFFASKGVTWPTLATDCLPSPAKLVSQIEAILLAGGDYEGALEQKAVSDGAGAIECAVAEATQALMASKGKIGAPAQAVPAAERGKAFLAKVRAK